MSALDVATVIDRLGYDDGEDLVREGDRPHLLTPARRHAWSAARERLGVSAAYFEGRVPLVYFAGLRVPSDREVETEIARLHQRTWNQSRAQLLIVVLPTEVRVLDGRAASQTHGEIAVAEKLEDQRLEPFTRASVLSGRSSAAVAGRRSKPVVLQLREDLRVVRQKLLENGLGADSADQLLTRCLFAQYLDARDLLGSKALGARGRFVDCLNESVADSYTLFDVLRARFNGDTFTVTRGERKAVTDQHLQIVASFLSGTAGTGQLTLVDRYDFRVIPAEVLGRVYEEFVTDHQRSHAAYYTPGHLVDAALDEAMPGNEDMSMARVLDPACGSGLFLARAYERLLDHLEEKLGRAATPQEMAGVLEKQVFGCDLMEDALRVAALSCYLVLLDRVGADHDSGAWCFPEMLGRNLRPGDFFKVADELEGPYEVIASNPPWKNATAAAKRYLSEHDRPAGSKLTLAQAFFWASLDRLARAGRMALLMPAASLYKQRPSERAFQTQALGETGLEIIVDFSAFRHQLFADASAPCALYVAAGDAERHREDVTFSAPKPSPVSDATGRIAIDADRVIRVPRRELARDPRILRRLVFGDLRDARLIDRLSHLRPTLGSLERGDDAERWVIRLGYQIGGGDNNDLPLLREIPSIHPDGLLPFGVREQAPIKAERFHRPRIAELYSGPRVLLARAVDPSGAVRAAYYERPASFSETIIGFVPPSSLTAEALALCGFLNSSLARYLLFMGGSSWGIERPQLKQQDVATLPVPFLVDTDAVHRLAGITARASPTNAAQAVSALDELLNELFDLDEDELALIEDRLHVQLPAYNDAHSQAAYGVPSQEELDSYRRTLQRTLRGALGTKATVDVERDDGGLLVTAAFQQNAPSVVRDHHPDAWLSVPSGTLLLRRPQRTYGPDWCQLRKFSERREVTRAAALHDGDEIISELLRAAARREQLGALDA